MIVREKVLITVKTYPTLSKKHTELVCTAGIREDGSWVRIYPTPFRFLHDASKFKKYDIIELDLERNPKDRRPESHRPTNKDEIWKVDSIIPGRDWSERRRRVLDPTKIQTGKISGRFCPFGKARSVLFSRNNVALAWPLTQSLHHHWRFLSTCVAAKAAVLIYVTCFNGLRVLRLFGQPRSQIGN